MNTKNYKSKNFKFLNLNLKFLAVILVKYSSIGSSFKLAEKEDGSQYLVDYTDGSMLFDMNKLDEPVCWYNPKNGSFKSDDQIQWNLDLTEFQVKKFKSQCRRYGYFKFSRDCKLIQCHVETNKSKMSASEYEKVYRSGGPKSFTGS